MLRCWQRSFPILAILIAVSSPLQAVEPGAPEHLISVKQANVIKLRIKLASFKRPDQPEAAYETDGLSAFYGQHKGGLIWLDGPLLNARARQVIAVLQDAASWGLDPADFGLPPALENDTFTASGLDEKIDTELRIGLALLRYARHARGGQVNPVRLSLDFDRKPEFADPQRLLSRVQDAEDIRAYLESLHPRHPQFHLLREAYLNILIGAGAAPAAIRQRQSTTVAQLPRHEAILLRKLRVNMQMWRWIPRDLGDRYVWVNIPEYQVSIVDAGQTVYRERVVVGDTAHKTPLFSDKMETIVFQPYWYVPNSIKVKQVLPRLLEGEPLRDLKIAARVGGEEIDPYSVDWYSEDIRKFVVYQPPNRDNALGRVKFLFPNKHAVYFHDTPEKELFRHRQRAYSHGCMRVRNPLEFARVLLHEEQGWTQEKIRQLASSGPENNAVKLKRAIPVHIAYFTAWVGDGGKLRTFKDVYRHEPLIAKGLAGRLDEIERPKAEDLANVRSQVLSEDAGFEPSRQRRNLNYTPFVHYDRSALGRQGPRLRRYPRRWW